MPSATRLQSLRCLPSRFSTSRPAPTVRSSISDSDMGLLAGYRRYWGLVWLAVLAVPLAVQVLQPAATVSEGEARILTAMPSWPRTAPDWRALPRRIDAFL